METTFYDDNLSVKKMKTSMTLDLSSMPNTNKHEKLSDLLATPDVGLFISTPDLERWITHQQGNMVLTTPTPTDASQILFPKTVTEEQEAYARGFIDALGKFYENPPNMSTTSSSTSTNLVQSSSSSLSKTSAFGQVTSSQFDLPLSSNMKTLNSVTFSNILSYNNAINNVSYSNNTNNGITKLPQPKQTAIITTSQPSIFHHQTLPQKPIKVETYQTVPLSPPNNSLSSSSSSQSPPASMSQSHISPINMEDQEMAKLERKRARNRIAATRCRNRKLERISRLEDRVNELKDQNLNLAQTASFLREQVLKLKQTIVEHTQQGCQVMLTSKFLDSSAIFN